MDDLIDQLTSPLQPPAKSTSFGAAVREKSKATALPSVSTSTKRQTADIAKDGPLRPAEPSQKGR